jgi:hypothetical protein
MWHANGIGLANARQLEEVVPAELAHAPRVESRALIERSIEWDMLIGIPCSAKRPFLCDTGETLAAEEREEALGELRPICQKHAKTRTMTLP